MVLLIIVAGIQALSPWFSFAANASHSHPASWFIIVKDRLPQPGELAAWEWPTDLHYYPGAVIVKNVMAVAPARMHTDGRLVWVDQQPIGTALMIGNKKQPLPVSNWEGSIPDGWIVIGAPNVVDSWDSRYYGPIPPEWVTGTAIPIW